MELLATEVETAQGPESVRAAVDRWADIIAEDPALADWHYRTALTSDMAGRLMVTDVEASDDLSARAHVRQEGSFLDLDFPAAVEFFRAKEVMEPEAFDDLADRYRAGGFTARELASEGLRDKAKATILEGLEGGLTIEEMSRQIRDQSASIGIEPPTPHAVDTIVRTNVASAYGAGKWEQYNDPEVKALRPMVQYLTAGDSRVRPNHRLLDGKVFELGSELARQYAPPLGFMCRCIFRSLRNDDLDRLGLAVTREPVDGGGADDRWDRMPGPLGFEAER